MARLDVTVNGTAQSRDIPDAMRLVQFLREELELTGTHIGCDTRQCGACIVHVDGAATKSCAMLAVQTRNRHVVTIEGIGSTGDLHVLQKAFREHHALQCGFCTPGMIMTSIDMIARLGPDLTRETIRSELKGNICRCTGYETIVDAIHAVAVGAQ